MMSHSRSSSVFALALIFTLVAAPKPSAAFITDPVLAQTAPDSFPLPDSVPRGTTVQIDGSNSAATVNQALKQRFEEQYSDTSIELEYSGTATALQALLNEEIDIAAIGRSLTEAEKAQGLTEVPLGRHKVAIIIGANNPFNGNITFEQFAQIFRGEITDWAELGGEPGPIRMVDHPEDSDTRLALAQYPVFQNAPFATGETAIQVNQDVIDAIVGELGTNGISYIVAEQVFDRPDVKIVPMHQTLPDDPRYPFSQPLVYAYRGEATPAVASFLGFAAAPVGQTAIESVGVIAQPGVTESPEAALAQSSPTDVASPDPAAVSPSAISPGEAIAPDGSPVPETAQNPGDGTATDEGTASTATNRQQNPAWLWWLIPLLLGIPLLWWLFKGRRPAAASTEDGGTPAVPPSGDATLAERAGTVISADRTSIAATQAQTPPPPVSPSGTSPAATAGDVGDAGSVGLAGAALGGAALAGVVGAKTGQPNRIVLVPRTANQAYAYWETSEENQAALRQAGGRRYTLRICDVTDINISEQSPHSIQQYPCDEAERDRHVPILRPDRDYIAEIGYQTDDEGWLLLARSAPVRVSSAATEIPSPDTSSPDIPSSITSIQSTTTQIQPDQSQPDQSQPEVPVAAVAAAGLVGAGMAAGGGTRRSSQIALAPRSAEYAYAAWDVPDENKAVARQQGGSQYVLRICDVTGIDLDQQPAHNFQEYPCQETDTNRTVPILQADRDYIAEIGYLTRDDRWLMLARSTPVRVAASEGRLGDRVPSPDQEAVQEAVEATKFNVGQSDLRGEGLADVDANLPDLPAGYGESQIFLLPRDPNWAYTYWDVPSGHKEALRRQGGTRLALRFYDVTHIDLATQNPHSLQQYDCDELARDWYLPVPISDRDYIVEIGYLTNDGTWLMLARSLPTRVPPIYPAEWLEEQFITVDWEENLRGKSQFDLKQPAPSTFDSTLYDKIFSLAEAAETQRLAGSLFGSMQHVPEQAISSFAFPSGIGMSGAGMSGVGMSGAGMSGAGIYTASGMGMSGVGMGLTMSGVGMSGIGMMSVPTASGIGMSGIGMSGIGMSGIGMSGIGMSGIGMSGAGMYTESGIGMSGIGMGWTMSGVGMSGIGMAASIPPIRPRQFWLVADAELIVYGATEPDATLMVGDRVVKLNPDGTFRFQVAFPDGDIRYPIMAIAADGEQTRSIQMEFHRETPTRNTNTKDEATPEWFRGEE